MASIYRFTRKSKKEEPKGEPGKKANDGGEDFFPLLFENEENSAAKAPVTGEEIKHLFEEEMPVKEFSETAPPLKEEKAKKQEKKEPDLSETREVSLKDTKKKADKKEKAELPPEATQAFVLPQTAENTENTRAFVLPTKEEALPPKKEKKKKSSASETEMQSTPSKVDAPAEEEIPAEVQKKDESKVPEALIRALQEDNAAPKLDEVFSSTKGTLSAETSKEEYDATTALLMEVFGGTGEKKKKKKKSSAAPETSAEEIHEVFHDTKTLSEALNEAVTEASTPIVTENAAENGDDYIAIHDSQEEKTKEYHATFSIEEELSKIQPVESEASIPALADEVRVSEQDNPYSDTFEELDEKTEKAMGLPDEFTSQEEYDEFAEHLRGRNYRCMCRTLWSFLAFLLILYLESATYSDLYHPEILSPGGTYHSVIYLLADIQLVLIAALICLAPLGGGLRALFRGKPNRDSVSVFMVLFALVHPTVLLLTGTQEYPLFGTLAALFLLLGSVTDFLDSKRIFRTFRVCGRQGEKMVATELPEDCAEAEAFREQLKGEPKFFSVHKAKFVSDFFSRLDAPGKADRSYGYSLIFSFLISAAFAALSFTKQPGLAETTTAFVTTAMMTFPLSGLFTVSLPFSHLSKKAEKRNCAIISAAAADEYAACDVVSFTDKEIFPPKSVKVTTIRTYGQTRIDKAILYAAMIFQKLGGPLSFVFKKAISGVYDEIPENFDFLEITADGMCAKIDGKDVFVGDKNYLLSYDFGYTKDAVDEAFEEKSGRIMYMVIGSELAAKFYIRYSISKRFKKTIFSLFKCGICPAVKTCDPNIDSDLFRTLLQNDKIPAGIIKTCEAMKDAPAEEASSAGLVCTSSIANLLYGFSLCESLRHLSRANVVIKTLSMLLGGGIVLFMHLFMGGISGITGLFALVYQLLWLIPVMIPSLSE